MDSAALKLDIAAREIRYFVEESNRIEGITSLTSQEIDAHLEFLSAPPTVARLTDLVSVCAKGHRLRDKVGLNVRVGDHIAPAGGGEIRLELETLCAAAPGKMFHPYEAHCRYETLHPFTDGNGRSGRAFWLWMMLDHGNDPCVLRRGFLHTWYYQSLSQSR